MLATKNRTRLWDKVDVRGVNDCWPWLASRNADGYGQFSLNGKILGPHRIVYREYYGDGLDEPDPTFPSRSLTVMHDCDHPWCCNPAHLKLGTNAENNQDMVVKGRERHVSGEAHGQHKLTSVQILEIREKYATGRYTYLRLADEYGVSDVLIGKIVRREIWRHIE